MPKGSYADLDQFQLGSILVYRTLVPVRSPSSSRPPSVYRRVWSGDYYEAWQRPEPSPIRIIEHLPLGNGLQPAAVPPCSEVLRLGRVAAEADGRLAAVQRAPVRVVDLTSGTLPAGWQPSTEAAGAVYPVAPGTLEVQVDLPADGHYGFWLAGGFRRQLVLSVDGRVLATAQHHLNRAGVGTPLGEADLASGRHTVVLRYNTVNLTPGSGGVTFSLGPLVVSRPVADPPVTYVQPGNARSLCGKSLDWIEAIAP